MSKLYKLTDENGKTGVKFKNTLQWGVGVTHTAKGEGKKLCTDGVIHAYEDPLIAVFMNPIHRKFAASLLWEAEGEVVVRSGQTQCGVKTLTTVRKIPVPEITLEQRVRFAIFCALEVFKEKDFACWAQKWLSDEDRSAEAAESIWLSCIMRVVQASNIEAARWAAQAAAASFAAGTACASAKASSAWAAETAAEAALASNAWTGCNFNLFRLAEQAVIH